MTSPPPRLKVVPAPLGFSTLLNHAADSSKYLLHNLLTLIFLRAFWGAKRYVGPLFQAFWAHGPGGPLESASGGGAPTTFRQNTAPFCKCFLFFVEKAKG